MIQEHPTNHPLISSCLLSDIQSIIDNNNDSDANLSNEIMARLRKTPIFLRTPYFYSFRRSPEVTVDPNSEMVKFKLDENDLIEDYIKIYAYSFGPFNPERYFAKENFRILWILKEPYMELGDIEKYKSGKYRYLGGFDQTSKIIPSSVSNDLQYLDHDPQLKYTDISSIDTIDNLIKITQCILQEFQGITEDEYGNITNCGLKTSIEYIRNEDDLDNLNNVMNHICILEVNHFPGLAFNTKNSTQDLIRDWYLKNEDLLTKFVDFYKPHLVIIGGKSTLTDMIVQIYNNKESRDYHFFNWTRVKKVSEYAKEYQYKVLGRNICPESDYRKVLESDNLKEETQVASIFQDEKGCVWFPWHHPANPAFNTYWHFSCIRIAEFIKDFLLRNQSISITYSC